MLRKTLAVATMLVAATAARADIILTENFDDISTLSGSGWSLINNSTPGGETGWFQGNLFDAQAGASDSYVAANFLNAGSGGTISNWLLSPTLTLFDGLTLSFHTRTSGSAPFADRLEVRLSQNGESSDVGATPDSAGDFGLLTLTINPSLSDAYPSDWTQYSVTLSGVTEGTLGRFGFRYFVSDTSVNGDYIGIDSVMAVPEPSTFALMLIALLPLGLAARRRKAAAMSRKKIAGLTIGMTLAASTCIAADSPAETSKQNGLMSFPNVRVVNAPIAAQSQPAADKSAGMRVYIDPQTKKIREQTPEEAQEAAAASKVQVRASARGLRSSAATDSADTFYGPGNTVGINVGEETMVFQVAHKHEHGAHTSECVTGTEAEKKAHAHSHNEEVRHDR